MTIEKLEKQKQKLQVFEQQLIKCKQELSNYEEELTANEVAYAQELKQFKKINRLIEKIEKKILKQKNKIERLESQIDQTANSVSDPEILHNSHDHTNLLPLGVDEFEDLKQKLQDDDNGVPFVDGDLEIRITVNFPIKEIVILDKNGQQIASSKTNYLEVLAKTNCVPPGEKYTIKIIGKSDGDLIQKEIEKNEKGDLVVYTLPNYSSVFTEYKRLVDNKKYREAVEYIIKTYGFDKNQCPTYQLKITDDPWTGLTTEGSICGEQTINVRTGFLKVGIKSEAHFSQIVSAIGHEFVHIRQKGDLGMTEHIEREFLAYYWEVFQQGLPVMAYRRKFAAEQALNKYVTQFNELQKEKYKSHIKRIMEEYESKYKK